MAVSGARRRVVWVVGGLLAAVCGLPGPSTPIAAAGDHGTGAVRVAAAGDSLTFGFGTADPPRTAYPARAGLVGLAENGACVSVRCPDDYDAFRWFGDRLAALPTRPEVVVAMFGINDLVHWRASIEEVVAGYHRLERVAGGEGVRVVFATLTPITEEYERAELAEGNDVEQRRRELNAWIRAQPDHLDYESALADGRGWLPPAYGIGDGVHLSDAGAQQLAEVLERWVVENDLD